MKIFFVPLSIFCMSLLAACGGAATPPTPTPSAALTFATALPNQVPVHTDVPGQPHTHIDPSQATVDIQLAIVPSELSLGPNRFAVGLLDAKGQVIRDAAVHFHYFDLSNASGPALESEADAVRITTPDGLMSIFAHEREFKRAGDWGVEVQARFPDGKAAIKRIGFKVVTQSPTLKPGQKAPLVETPTLASANNDLHKLTSSTTPNASFYQLSLAKAIGNGKPTVLVFATPAFCQTRFCGPAYDVASEVQKRNADKANFIHVEVYTGLPNPAANNFQIAPPMLAFGLQTEPWVFFIKSDGTIDYRIEGPITADEIERHLKALLGT
jgi:hypothetical protein